MKTKVSAVIITYNEASNLGRTLSHLYWCDEIIVVDSYSTDDTVAICRYYGCKVFYRSFMGNATNDALKICVKWGKNRYT
jgi:glycosyltransferase involved in cell wall biosynthesis